MLYFGKLYQTEEQLYTGMWDALKFLNCQVVKKDISADACQEVFTSLYGLVRRLGIGTPGVG